MKPVSLAVVEPVGVGVVGGGVVDVVSIRTGDDSVAGVVVASDAAEVVGAGVVVGGGVVVGPDVPAADVVVISVIGDVSVQIHTPHSSAAVVGAGVVGAGVVVGLVRRCGMMFVDAVVVAGGVAVVVLVRR